MAKVEENLLCSICLEYCTDPVESSCCSQLYCSACTDPLDKNCPMCRQGCDFKKSVLARRMIDMIGTECMYCGYKCCRGDLSDHFKKCEQVTVSCPIEDCGAVVRQSDLFEHLASTHKDECKNRFDDIINLFKVKNDLATDTLTHSVGTLRNSRGAQARLGATGKYYCGRELDGPKCYCCNGLCGISNGCNCSSCMQLDLKGRSMPKGWLVNRDGYAARKSGKKYYCGRNVMVGVAFCDGYCGPTDGQNCPACEKLDQMSVRGGRYHKLI